MPKSSEPFTKPQLPPRRKARQPRVLNYKKCRFCRDIKVKSKVFKGFMRWFGKDELMKFSAYGIRANGRTGVNDARRKVSLVLNRCTKSTSKPRSLRVLHSLCPFFIKRRIRFLIRHHYPRHIICLRWEKALVSILRTFTAASSQLANRCKSTTFIPTFAGASGSGRTGLYLRRASTTYEARYSLVSPLRYPIQSMCYVRGLCVAVTKTCDRFSAA